jgi:predicted component of type VI protein secretion system
LPKSPLVVHVEEPETGATWDYVFDAGPVIVGRGDDVALQIARPFVSLHHGTFDFDDQGVSYVDLESRNGTLVDGVARGSDRPVPVTEASEIRIGKVRLRVSREAPPAPVGEEKPNPFAPKKGVNAAKKGTDALPREDVERIRREILARKEPVAPPPVVRPAIEPPIPRIVLPPPVAAPMLEKTVPVPLPGPPPHPRRALLRRRHHRRPPPPARSAPPPHHPLPPHRRSQRPPPHAPPGEAAALVALPGPGVRAGGRAGRGGDRRHHR